MRLPAATAIVPLLSQPSAWPVAWPEFGGAPRAAVRMGVSDRMATDGMLYDEWGKEGMRVLNKTSTLQAAAEELEINRYDAVLIAAKRAKDNAFQSMEQDTNGYIGNSFGGAMGGISRKPPPIKSHVVRARATPPSQPLLSPRPPRPPRPPPPPPLPNPTRPRAQIRAIEELCEEVEENGELPALTFDDEFDGDAEPTDEELEAAAAIAAEADAAAHEAAVLAGGVLAGEGELLLEDGLNLDVDIDEEFDDVLGGEEAERGRTRARSYHLGKAVVSSPADASE